LLIDTVMRLRRQRRILAGFEIHEIGARRSAVQRLDARIGFVEKREVHAERAVGRLGPRDRLKDQIDRTAPLHDLHGCRHMGEHAGLHGNIEAQTQLLDPFEKGQGLLRAVRCRIDPDAGVAAAVHEAVEDGRSDTRAIVGRVIGLDAHAEAAWQTDRGAKPRDHRNLFRNGDQILVTHEFRHSRRHFRRDSRREAGQRFGGCHVGQQKIAKLPGRHRGDWRKGPLVMRIENEPCHLVSFVRHQGVVEKARKRRAMRAATRSSPLSAARPARRSPARSGEARARSMRKSAKT
jgi:hypothetical protein